jgi:hypothetical protein
MFRNQSLEFYCNESFPLEDDKTPYVLIFIDIQVFKQVYQAVYLQIKTEIWV